MGKRKKATGERMVFLQLIQERGNKSQISNKELFGEEHFQWHWQFSHVLPKGLYSRFRLYDRNIVLMLPEEHVYVTEHEGTARKNPLWQKYFALKEQLKQEYHDRKRVLPIGG